MAQIENVTERGVVHCLIRDCNFLYVDAKGPGINEAKRHADETRHDAVEVKIDATLTVCPDPEDAEEEEDAEAEEDSEEDGGQWVGTGDCENCTREDVDLHDWAGSSICVDCLVHARSGGL